MSVAEALGERLSVAKEVQAATLETTLFLNRGDRFEPVVLPAEAQWAPAFAINAADLSSRSNERMAECGGGSVIAHPASGFSDRDKLT